MFLNKRFFGLRLIDIIILYFILQIFFFIKDTRDIAMLDCNDKVKSEYNNLISNGFINANRIPSAVNACSYATVEFGLGVLSDYNIANNVKECQAIREHAGVKSPFYNDMLRWFLGSNVK